MSTNYYKEYMGDVPVSGPVVYPEGSGGGPVDAYTKAQTNALLAQKADNEYEAGTTLKQKIGQILTSIGNLLVKPQNPTNGQVPTYNSTSGEWEAKTPSHVYNSTITIQKNGADVDSFTTNRSSNKSINITMAKSDVGLGNVDNTSDLDKPISTATQATLDTKANNNDVTTALGLKLDTSKIVITTSDPGTGSDTSGKLLYFVVE